MFRCTTIAESFNQYFLIKKKIGKIRKILLSLIRTLHVKKNPANDWM